MNDDHDLQDPRYPPLNPLGVILTAGIILAGVVAFVWWVLT